VSAETWNEFVRMSGCALAVAGVAVPAGLLAWAVARRTGDWLLPRPRGWRVPWGGFEVFAALAVVSQVVPLLVGSALSGSGVIELAYAPERLTLPAESESASAAAAGTAAASVAHDRAAKAAATVRMVWVGLTSLPLQLGLLLAVRATLFPSWRPPIRRPGLAGSVALAVIAWAVLLLVVLGVHFGVILAFDALGWPIEEHPLTQLTAERPRLDQILFALQACVAAPLLEEVLFRGVLLPWLLGRAYRPWPVLGVAVLLGAALAGGNDFGVLLRGPTLFAAALVGGWAVLAAVLPRKRRTWGAIYASAALFAVVHSGVWPSPIPLFVLGLGLGWLAVRTRGVLVPTIVHGLFNAVSVLLVLRGG
jgi:membrane protease YdiL (CAAX protease family)